MGCTVRNKGTVEPGDSDMGQKDLVACQDAARDDVIIAHVKRCLRLSSCLETR